MKCNFNVVLGAIQGSIPGQNGGQAVAVERKLYFPKATVAKWINKHLTTAHIKYKTVDKIVSSEPSQYKVDRYFEYLPTKVLEVEAEMVQKSITSNICYAIRDTKAKINLMSFVFERITFFVLSI